MEKSHSKRHELSFWDEVSTVMVLLRRKTQITYITGNIYLNILVQFNLNMKMTQTLKYR